MFDIINANPIVILLGFIGLVIAITIHEFAHAFMADKLGDPTPSLQGRLTPNPLAHLDPLGTLMIVIAHFGWGKPVQFDPYNFQKPQRDTILVALAGPIANFIVAILLSLLLRISPDMGSFLSNIFISIVYLNVMLGVFNLIPIYPLDGGQVLINILPDNLRDEASEFFHRYGQLILILMIMPFTRISPVSSLITPIISFILQLLLP